jgi:hypothetical protein
MNDEGGRGPTYTNRMSTVRKKNMMILDYYALNTSGSESICQNLSYNA